MRKLRLGEGRDWCKVIRKVSGRVDSSFKYPDPSPGSLLDAGGFGSVLQVLLAHIRSWSGWDPSGVGSGLCAAARAHLNTGFP